jgi:hypothetical protein
MDHPFDAADLEMLVKVVQLHPEAELAAYIAKLARTKIRYPITSHDDLLPLLDKPDKHLGTLKYRERTLTFQDAEQFLPKAFFPIESEDDLLQKSLIALYIGRKSHFREIPVASADPNQ